MTAVAAQPEPEPPSILRRALRSVGVLAVFGIVGPAVGGVLAFSLIVPVMLLGLNPATAETNEGTGGLAAALGMLPFFVAFAYMLGGPQALLAGIWAAFATWRSGSFSGRAAVIAAVVATILWAAMLYLLSEPFGLRETPEKLRNMMQTAIALSPIGIASALFCRWACGALGLTRQPA